MKRIKVTRVDGVVDILLLKHKTYNGYSFVNLTKGHICPCVFKSEEEALSSTLDLLIDREALYTAYEKTLFNKLEK